MIIRRCMNIFAMFGVVQEYCSGFHSFDTNIIKVISWTIEYLQIASK
jgi:hypothetical protein